MGHRIQKQDDGSTPFLKKSCGVGGNALRETDTRPTVRPPRPALQSRSLRRNFPKLLPRFTVRPPTVHLPRPALRSCSLHRSSSQAIPTLYCLSTSLPTSLPPSLPACLPYSFLPSLPPSFLACSSTSSGSSGLAPSRENNPNENPSMGDALGKKETSKVS